jgi:thioredoxin-related protein
MQKWPRLVVAVLGALLLMPACRAGEQVSPKWMAFNDGIAEAKRTGRKVMIDVYTDWCGWCKKMDKDTYADGGIADYLNKKFVAIRLNAESENTLQYRGKPHTEQELAGAFGITGYPSIIFLNDDGEPITVYPGYADAAKFKIVLAYIAEDHYKTTTFQEYLNRKR